MALHQDTLIVLLNLPCRVLSRGEYKAVTWVWAGHLQDKQECPLLSKSGFLSLPVTICYALMLSPSDLPNQVHSSLQARVMPTCSRKPANLGMAVC